VALAALAAGCGGKAPEPIRLGHLVVSGADQRGGEQARQGVQLAVEEWNKEAADRGGRQVLVLHVTARSEAEAVRLLSVNRVVALIVAPEHLLAEGAARAAGRYEAAVVVAGELASPPPGVFPVGAGPAQRGRALARFAAGELKAGRAAVLTDGRDPVAAAVASGFLKGWPHAEPPVSRQWVDGQGTDLAPQATEAAKAKAGVELIAGPPADVRAAAAALHAAGLRVPLLHGGQDGGAAALEGLPDGADVYLVTAYAPEGLTDAGKDFARRYEERFHAAPDLHAALAYDGARLLLAALRKAPDVTPSRLRAQLAKREPFEGVTGPWTWKDGEVRRPLFLLRLENNRAKLVKSLGADAD
jgi:branched-chain amino acid transport system substrate-binding protein